MTLQSVKCWDTMWWKSLNRLPKTIFCSCKDHKYCLEHAFRLRLKITWACTTTSPRVRFINAGDVGYKTTARMQSQSKHRSVSFQSKFQQKQDRSHITENLIKYKEWTSNLRLQKCQPFRCSLLKHLCIFQDEQDVKSLPFNPCFLCGYPNSV